MIINLTKIKLAILTGFLLFKPVYASENESIDNIKKVRNVIQWFDSQLDKKQRLKVTSFIKYGLEKHARDEIDYALISPELPNTGKFIRYDLSSRYALEAIYMLSKKDKNQPMKTS